MAPRDVYAATSDDGAATTAATTERTADSGAAHGASQNRSSVEANLPELLADSEGQYFHDVWDLYCRLEPNDRPALQTRVLQYLSRSQSMVEASRALSIFPQTPTEMWDNDFLSASVLVMLRSGNHALALDTFKKGLQTKGLIGGLDYLLIDSANRQQWATMLDAWLAYYEYTAQKDPDVRLDDTLLAPLSSLDSLGALYFSFERYLDADEMRVERWLDLDKVTKAGLRVLRRRFAIEALRQPCPPNQASVILSFWNDHRMYERYLWRMFDRWYTKRISPATARMLPAIYRDFKSLPGAKPSVDILRGIFKVNYPNNAAALEELYRDWIRFWGDLNQWGFEKFLKFFAHRGDVERVQELWSRFVERFPWKLETPKGFRSTMNVYAQNGDVHGAENEMKRMTEQYKVEPDLDIWNTLLKCYVRADDYNKVMTCFEDICKKHQPNSYTYAHVMAMSSKKGDLDRTIGFFNEAQKNGVLVTKEMGLALVVVFCRNDWLEEAEKICRDLAERRITSTAMWNHLIHHNGMNGRLTKCYELLNDMKKFNLEWDRETIGHLLSALVQVKQITPAYQIVRDGLKNNMHVLEPEHFATVMMGAVRTGDRGTAEALMSLMEKASIPVPFNAMVAYTQAALKEAPHTVRTPQLGKEIVATLRALVGQQSGDIQKRRRGTAYIGRAVQVLVQFRDFASAEELMNLFIELFPQYGESEALPQDVLASLMLAYHRDENYTRVVELWHEAWPKILKRCAIPRQEEGVKALETKETKETKEIVQIYAAHQYDVTRLVFRMAATYRAMGDGEGLLKCVEQVVGAGFKLTSITWDRVIRGLAEMGKWERAMHYCETMLMPGWRGWRARKAPLDERRETMNTRTLRPTHTAVLLLQKEWLAMRRLAVWSSDVAHRLSLIEQRHPMLYHAFMTSETRDVPGPWIFRGDVDLVKATTELLTPLPVHELRRMAKVLRRQLKDAEDTEDAARRADMSPFRRLGADPMDTDTRALQEIELQILRSVLQRRLTDSEARLRWRRQDDKGRVKQGSKKKMVEGRQEKEREQEEEKEHGQEKEKEQAYEQEKEQEKEREQEGKRGKEEDGKEDDKTSTPI